MTLLAGQTALWLGLGLAAGLLFAIGVLTLFAAAFAVFDGDADDIADVQRFIELTEEARRLVPAGLPLFDSEKAAATTDAIIHFQAKKDEARRALWASRGGRPATAIAVAHATATSPTASRHLPSEQSGVGRTPPRSRAAAR